MADDLAAQFEAANCEAVDCVLGPASGHWEATTPEEGWPVGVAARHIALGHQLMLGWLAALQAGEPITGDPGDIDRQNAEVAALGVVASPEEVADELRHGGQQVAEALRRLTDADLEREVDFAGQPMPGSRVAGAAERHVRTHLASIEAACS